MYANKKKNNFSKVVVLLLCLSLLIGGVIGGTIAYLMDNTKEVKNTFIAGNVGVLDLKETSANSFVVTPGVNITKDPTVTFKGNNVDVYVFVKVDASGWSVATSGTTHTYTIGENGKEMRWTLDGWNLVEGNEGVYYKAVNANASDNTWKLITDDTIFVPNTITASEISKYASNLNFTAYAIQKAEAKGDDFTPAEAWALVKDLDPKAST